MAMRATATATISFGLVAVPVKIFSATEPASGVSFNLLHRCGSRVKQQYVCTADGQVVERKDMLKGFEHVKGSFVVFTQEEIKALEEQATQSIDIVEFLPAGAVNPLHYDKPYFLGPDKGGGKAYCLLASAMRSTGREAVAHYAARGKSYVVLLRAEADGIVLHQLLYADEVRSMKDVPLEHVPVRDQELKMAEMLIENLAGEKFVPEKYEDTGKAKMLTAIQQKIDGGEVALPELQEKKPTVDLMAALQASLKKAS